MLDLVIARNAFGLHMWVGVGEWAGGRAGVCVCAHTLVTWYTGGGLMHE